MSQSEYVCVLTYVDNGVECELRGSFTEDSFAYLVSDFVNGCRADTLEEWHDGVRIASVNE